MFAPKRHRRALLRNRHRQHLMLADYAQKEMAHDIEVCKLGWSEIDVAAVLRKNHGLDPRPILPLTRVAQCDNGSHLDYP